MPIEDQEQDGVYIDGELYEQDDLSYREQRDMRQIMQDLNGPDFDAGDAALIDIIPAFVTVVKRRSDPEFTIDQALDLKPADLVPPKPGKKGRPTKGGR